ncbi:MAG: hypothetical protein EBS89_06040, partial [Proteobacteria bacterium]|nr:hypothetical protein [Pseudomonadota bacterium]
EDLKYVLEPMSQDAEDSKWSMGDDTPLAVLSTKPRPLYVYFRQRFAQVTNPPIDPLREGVVMSLDTFLGRRHNLLAETEGHASLLGLTTPVMLDDEFDALLRLPEFRAVVLDALFDPTGGEAALDAALDQLCDSAVQAIDGGASIIASARTSGCAPTSSSRPVKRGTSITSPASSGSAQGRSTRTSPSPAHVPSWANVASRTDQRSNLRRTSARRPTRASCGSCPRWASPRSQATGVPRFSRRSAFPNRSWTGASTAHRRA